MVPALWWGATTTFASTTIPGMRETQKGKDLGRFWPRSLVAKLRQSQNKAP
jgi:hypothetical protein